jgi:hypothetical protein
MKKKILRLQFPITEMKIIILTFCLFLCSSLQLISGSYESKLAFEDGALSDFFGSYLSIDNDNDGYAIDEGDCDDNNPDIHPGAADICDGIDNNCNGQTDDDNALYFDGSNDYVNLGTWFNLQSFTIELWIKPGNTQQIWTDIIDNNHSNYRSWVVQQRGPGYDPNDYQFGLAYVGSIPFHLTPEVWQHLAVTIGGGTMAVYINGELISSRSTSNSIVYDGTQFLRLSAWGGGGRHWNGFMDEVRIWDVVRSQTQIQSNMINTLSPQPGLVVNYHFDEGIASGDNSSLTTLIDDSGNQNHGTLVNFAKIGDISNWVFGNSISTWYQDSDGDGYGNPTLSLITCIDEPQGYVLNDDDCNDAHPDAHTGAADICDGIDNNCNGLPDDDNALYFDGNNDYVNLGTWFDLQSFTIELWVKPGSTQQTWTDIIDNNHTDYRSWVVQQRGPGYDPNDYQFGISYVGSVPFHLTPEVWQHLAVTIGGGTMAVYINGELIDSRSTTNSIVYDGTQFLRLSAWGGGGRHLNGIIDEVRIWDVVRSQTQIQSNMDHSLSSQAGLIVNFHFDEGIGGGDNSSLTTLIDESGNHNHGTLKNFAKIGNISNWVLREDNPIPWFLDSDGDGYGTPDSQILAICAAPEYSTNNDDCDDNNSEINPSAVEVCGNNLDDNCDGEIDEGCCNMTVEAGDNVSTFFGIESMQQVDRTVEISGGTAPFSYSWSLGRPLICNQENEEGDESFYGGTCSFNTCPESGSPADIASCLDSESITAVLIDTANICVLVTDANGCTAVDCFTVNASDARCFAGNSGNHKVQICHSTGNPNNPWVEICVDTSAVDSHLAHGDYVGACSEEPPAPPLNEGVNQSIKDELQVLAVFPNPTNGLLTIRYQLHKDYKIMIIITNTNGRHFSNVNTMQKKDLQSIKIDVGQLPTGIYFLHLKSEDQMVSRKFVIMR